MATWPPSLLSSLRNSKGVTDIRSPGLLALSPSSMGSPMLDLLADEFVKNSDDAEAFVERRVKENVDYIKVNADLPGFKQETLNAIVVRTPQTYFPKSSTDNIPGRSEEAREANRSTRSTIHSLRARIGSKSRIPHSHPPRQSPRRPHNLTYARPKNHRHPNAYHDGNGSR